LSACAQRAFTYTATDVQTVVLTDRSSVSIPVTTVIIISGGPAPDFNAAGPTDPFTVTLRPPQGDGARLVQAMVNGRLIQLSLTRTTPDGEYEAVANVPRTASESGQIHVLWTTKDTGYVETLVTGEPVRAFVSPAPPRHINLPRRIH
jgi:hypothetical protein